MLNRDSLEVTHSPPNNPGAMMSDFKPTLTEEDRAVARAFYLMMKPIMRLRSTMPAQYIMTFLEVAMQEGLGVSEYAERADVPPTVMTRHLLDIGDRNRAKEEGFGLITQERDKNDLRRHYARITPKGKAIFNEIKQAFKTGPR